MKSTVFKAAAALMALSFLVACGGNSNGRRNDSNRNRYNQTGGVNGTTFSASGQNYYSCSNSGDYAGSIYNDASSQFEYQEAVDAFLSSIADPLTFLSDVSGSCNSNTGVAFKGQVSVQNGFNRNGQNYSNINSNSSIYLAIIDQLAVAGNESPISINATAGANGYVDGNFAVIEAQWERGTIKFEGQIDYNQQMFYGTMSFYNFYHFDGGSGYNGTLGGFMVPMCSFFVCQ